MNDPNPTCPNVLDSAAAASIDAGLRRYMLRIYNKVAAGLLLAAGVAFTVSSLAPAGALVSASGDGGGAAGPQITGAGLALSLAPLAVLLVARLFLLHPTPARAAALYGLFAAAMGGALGVIALAFTGLTLATTFAVTATAFGGLSLFGYSTRRSLGGLGSFLAAGLVGLVAALAANLIIGSPALAFALDAAGVLIFSGPIAHDTQRLKLDYARYRDAGADLGVATTYGALSLFLSFVNLFQLLLLLGAGQRR